MNSADILWTITASATISMFTGIGAKRGQASSNLTTYFSFITKALHDLTASFGVHMGSRAGEHIPSYAKKLVSMYNENGEIDKLLSRKSRK